MVLILLNPTVRGLDQTLDCESASVNPRTQPQGRRRARKPARAKLVVGATRTMRFEAFEFGSIRIDGVTYEHDVVVDRGEVRERKKKPSKPFRDDFGHTPLSVEEKIPWKCRRLVIGTGALGALPVMDELKREAERRKVELLSLPTSKAIDALNKEAKNTNAVLHVTC